MARFFAGAIPESAIKALLQICPRPDKPMPLIGDLVPGQPARSVPPTVVVAPIKPDQR